MTISDKSQETLTRRYQVMQEIGIDPLIEPWDHQVRGLKQAMPLDGFGFFFEVGTGKSLTSILAARAKMARDKTPYRVLVITPLITLTNWQNEWRKFSRIDHSKIIMLKGTGKQRVEMVKKHFNSAQVFIASYETVTMVPVMNELLRWAPGITIVDEVHRCKNHKANRSIATAVISKRSKYRFVLTGTPILKNPMDLFGIFLIMDGGETFGKNFYQFRGQYFYDKNVNMPSLKKFPDWRITDAKSDEIKQKIRRSTATAVKSECLDLPPYVVKDIVFELEGDQLKVYRELEKDFIAYIEDKACVATMALTKAIRLQQISSGYISLEDLEGNKHVRKFEHNPRKKILAELLGDIAPHHKVIVWAVFKENYSDIEEVCRELGLGWVGIHGEIPAAEKFRNVDKFNTDPDCRVLYGHPGSGGVGINLVVANHSIFYSRSFSLENDLQAEARNYRGGSEVHSSITRINLVAEKTIDELVAKRLAAKQSMSDKIIFDIAKELKRG